MKKETEKEMKKRILLTALTAVLILTLGLAAGCGGNSGAAGADEEPVASASAGEMGAALLEKVDVATMQLDETGLKDFFGLDSEKYEEAVGYMAMMNVKAADLVIVKAKTPEDVADLKAGLEARQETNVQTWSQYLPDQYEIVKNYKLIEKGRYLLYVVAKDADGIAEDFESYFK